MKILVRSPNWVGDTVLITPALANLRAHYSQAHISVLVTPWVEPLLSQNPDVDELIVYDPKGKHSSWKARVAFAKELRQIGFDMAILFPNSFHAALITYLARIPQRIGYDTDGRGLLLTNPIPVTKAAKHKHLVEYYLDIIRHLGIEVQPQRLSLVLNPADEDFIKQLLASNKIDCSRPLIAMHPGAVKPEKRWAAERFAETAKLLTAKYKAAIILLGGPDEQELKQQIKQLAGSAQVIIPEVSTLTQTAALIKRCRLFIGNDSGLMHVAAALGVPIVAIFGPGTPATTAPWMDKALYRVVLEEVSCRPCRQKFFTECVASPQGKPPCLEAVSVEQVLNAADELLA